MSAQQQRTGQMRLALRLEGAWWVAYAAPLHTMEGAVELGRVAAAAVASPGTRTIMREAFQAAMGDLLQKITGEPVLGWNAPEAAPEHERGGRA